MTVYKGLKRSLGFLQIFIGVGAMFGGFGLLMDPSGVSLGMSVEYLRATPFPNFFIPGIILFSVNGIGTLIAAYFTFKSHKYASFLAMLFGAALIFWIVVQVVLIGYQSLLQPVYFVLGILEFILGFKFRTKQSQKSHKTVMV